ncbi:MAG: class I SAM-dependent methyltransferase [Actinomycetota bacterium]|nr:class I SAM-dependent methyltransferase [Actinomycetota bacterium]
MNREIDILFQHLPPDTHDAVEVSGSLRSNLPWRSYTSLLYPQFDLCRKVQDPPYGPFDLVICEQVLEHVPDPVRAASNLRELCRPGGKLVVSTPFLVKVHGSPGDYWRFTPDGLRVLLEGAGLQVEWVHSWGNRACVRRNLGRWLPHRRWHPLRNEPDFPVMVWALARRGA